MNYVPYNQAKLFELLQNAAVKKQIIGISAERGFGIKHTITKYTEVTHYVKVVLADVRYEPRLKGIIIALMRTAMNIRFSNLNYRRTTLHDLTLILKDRLSSDIKGDVVIFIDNVSKLGPEQLSYLVSFLKEFNKNPSCGIILRTTKKHLSGLARTQPALNDDLFLQTQGWMHFKPYTKEELSKMIESYGIKDEFIIEDISSKTSSFSIAKKFIDLYLNKIAQKKVAE